MVKFSIKKYGQITQIIMDDKVIATSPATVKATATMVRNILFVTGLEYEVEEK